MMIKQLGYLVFDFTPAILDRMTTIFSQLIGAPVTVEGKERLIRLDGRPFRLKFREGRENRLAAIGWEVGHRGALDGLSTRLREADHIVEAPDAAVLADRSAEALIAFRDGDGFPFEFFVDRPFVPDATLAERFVCGEEERGAFGLGHIVLICSDRDATAKLFRDVLGFGLSDRIAWPAADLLFLHCNKRHHSVALAGEVFGMKGGMIDHFMIETRSKAEVDRAYAALEPMGLKVSQTIGQHSNDNVYSFYMMTPAGFRVEFGHGGDIIPDPATWEPKEYEAPSNWGHELVH